MSFKNQIQSVTPKYDITWYVWIGAAGWWWVGYKWNDRAMQLVNGVFLFVLTGGLLRIFLG
jgi:hypothetical protein